MVKKPPSPQIYKKKDQTKTVSEMRIPQSTGRPILIIISLTNYLPWNSTHQNKAPSYTFHMSNCATFHQYRFISLGGVTLTRHFDKQTDKETDKETDKQADSHLPIQNFIIYVIKMKEDMFFLLVYVCKANWILYKHSLTGMTTHLHNVRTATSGLDSEWHIDY